MKAIIKQIHCSDVDAWDDYLPIDPTDFVLPFELSIGPSESKATDLFQILVCGSKWFEREIVAKKQTLPVHHMVMQEYDADLLERALKEKVASCEANTWDELGKQLGQFFHWEFENYQP